MAGAVEREEVEPKANELYWESDLSVNQIADKLDISKGMLYGLIRPRPTGLSCPICGDELVHPNRTAKERGLVGCGRCSWQGPEDEAEMFSADREDEPPGFGTVPIPPGTSGALLKGDRRVMVGGALLGAAAGLALMFWARRR
jgi:hypothetical protein